MTFGFGLGYGARSYNNSTAFKELMEKFPDAPTAEADALARRGATRALVLGTGLAGAMGVGAVMLARSYGIKSAAEFGDEARKWLPSKEGLDKEAAKLEPLTRSITKTMQSAKEALGEKVSKSSMGQYVSDKAQQNTPPATQKWEQEIVDKLEGKK